MPCAPVEFIARYNETDEQVSLSGVSLFSLQACSLASIGSRDDVHSRVIRVLLYGISWTCVLRVCMSAVCVCIILACCVTFLFYGHTRI